MASLPDEIWAKILEMGAETSRLNYRDLCSISITCRTLNRLSQHPSLWSTLLTLDFPHPLPSSSSSSSCSTSSSKTLYKTRFERDRARRHAAWRQLVLVAESKVAVCYKKLEELEGLVSKESERLKAAVKELSNLERVRRASVALNVWQPEVVRGSQKQIVEQCTVPLEARRRALEMEVKVSKQQIAIYNKAYNDQKQKREEEREKLKSLKYHPLQSYQLGTTAADCNVKRKKLKQNNDSDCPRVLSVLVWRCWEDLRVQIDRREVWRVQI